MAKSKKRAPMAAVEPSVASKNPDSASHAGEDAVTAHSTPASTIIEPVACVVSRKRRRDEPIASDAAAPREPTSTASGARAHEERRNVPRQDTTADAEESDDDAGSIDDAAKDDIDGDDDAAVDDDGDAVDDAVDDAADPAALPDAAPRKRKRVVASELTPEALAAFMEAEQAKGVVYLSRIPPYMKPITIRHLLRDYGELGRVYLAPEDPVVMRRRVESGGNKKQRWTEGWVEFLNKREAKAAAAMLNATPMGGNKRGFYGSDLWCIKYLKGFKWHHLTEKNAYESRVKSSKMRAELSAARKEADTYIARAEASKAIRKREDWTTAAPGDGLDAVRRSFVQRTPLHDPLLQPPAPVPAAATTVEAAGVKKKAPRPRKGGK